MNITLSQDKQIIKQTILFCQRDSETGTPKTQQFMARTNKKVLTNKQENTKTTEDSESLNTTMRQKKTNHKYIFNFIFFHGPS